MGADADPLKVALQRGASRVHATCVRKGTCEADAGGNVTALRAFERLLMLGGEHTWGWNGGDLRTPLSWANPALQYSLEHDHQYATAVVGWIEQRAILYNAVAALPDGCALAAAIQEEFAAIQGHGRDHGAGGVLPWKTTRAEVGGATTAHTRRPGASTRTSPPGVHSRPRPLDRDTAHVAFADLPLGSAVQCGVFRIVFGADGSIESLVDTRTGEMLADPHHTLGRFHYQGMDRAYFKKYVNAYVAGVSRIWPVSLVICVT